MKCLKPDYSLKDFFRSLALLCNAFKAGCFSGTFVGLNVSVVAWFRWSLC